MMAKSKSSSYVVAGCSGKVLPDASRVASVLGCVYLNAHGKSVASAWCSPLIRSPIRPTPCPSISPMPPRSDMAGKGRRAKKPEIIPPEMPPRIPPQTAMPPDHTSNTFNGLSANNPQLSMTNITLAPIIPAEDRPHRYRVDVFEGHAGPGRVTPGYPIPQQDSERRE